MNPADRHEMNAVARLNELDDDLTRLARAGDLDHLGLAAIAKGLAAVAHALLAERR